VIKTTIAGIIALLLFISCGKKEEEKVQPLEVLSAGPVPESVVEAFSGKRAYEHIVEITKFGPRPPESEGYRKTLGYLETYLKGLGWKTKRSSFQKRTPIGQVSFTNLIARFSPDREPNWQSSPPFLVSGHLDSKRYPTKTFLGVNDSGSSTGVMLEMARVLSEQKGAALNVEFVFFDGEEAMLEDMIFQKDGLYGSTNYAQQLRKRSSRPSLGIVIDLVGDPKVDLLIGADSQPAAITETQKAVKTLKLDEQVSLAPGSILDDHVPLIAYANLPVLHLIGDFQKMPYWHKEGDTLDKISPEALANAGKLTLQVLHQLTNKGS